MFSDIKILLLLCLFIFSSCKNNRDAAENKTSGSGLSLTYELDENTNLEIKDVVNEIELIPLETNDDVLIGKLFSRQPVKYVKNKYFIILGRLLDIYVYSSKGEFLFKSKDLFGEGPGQLIAPHYLAYNEFTNTFLIVDVFKQIHYLDGNLRFIKKKKLKLDSPHPINSFDIVNESMVMIAIPGSDETNGSVYIYDIEKNELIERVCYPGKIAMNSMNCNILNIVNNKFVFTPMDMNDNIFTFNPESNLLKLKYTINNGPKGLLADELEFKQENERGDLMREYRESNKFISFKKSVSSDYIVSIYMKNGKYYHHIYNLKTNNQKMIPVFTKDKPYIPFGFHLEDSTYYVLVNPYEVRNHIDESLLKDKSVLDNISDDDNPVIIKYHLKV